MLLFCAAVGAPYMLETVRCTFDIGDCENEYFIVGNDTDNYVIVVVREEGKYLTVSCVDLHEVGIGKLRLFYAVPAMLIPTELCKNLYDHSYT